MAEGGFLDPEDVAKLPTWMQVAVGCFAVQEAHQAEDPEDTLMMQLTLPELAQFSLGLMLQALLFPELTFFAQRTQAKLKALTKAQDYFEHGGDDNDDRA